MSDSKFSNFNFQTPQQPTLPQIQSLFDKAKLGSDEFDSAMAMLNALINQGDIEAKLYLSWLLTQNGAITNATQTAFKLCQEIATSTGHPAALERMADLMLWDVGIDKNEVESFNIYQKLANQGMLPLTTLAYLHSQGIGTEKDELQASNLILKSAAQGDTLSFILLAYRYEIGLGVPINGLLSRAYAMLAVKRKFPGAQQKLLQLNIRFASIDDANVDEMVILLIANIESLSSKVERLAQITPPNNPEFAVKYMELLSYNLDDLKVLALSTNPEIRGCEIKHQNHNDLCVEMVCDSPVVKRIHHFASFEECQYLISQSEPMLESTSKQMKTETASEIDAFSGDSAIFASAQTSPVNRIIQQRFADVGNVPVENFEPLSVLKYSVGHEYSLHTDAFDEGRIQAHVQANDFGGQRMTTNLIYLLPPDEGGETQYNEVGFKISGQIGMGVIHHNALDNGLPDPRSLHTGLTIIAGEKWLLRTATRQHPLYGINKVNLDTDNNNI